MTQPSTEMLKMFEMFKQLIENSASVKNPECEPEVEPAKLFSQFLDPPLQELSAPSKVEPEVEPELKSPSGTIFDPIKYSRHTLAQLLLSTLSSEDLLTLLKNNLNASNLAKMWNFAVDNKDEQLTQIFMNCLVKNMTDNDVISGLSFNVVKSITELKELPFSELKMFELVKKWNELTNPPNANLQLLLSNIKLSSIPSKDLITTVAPSKLLDSDTMLQIITDSYDPSKKINRMSYQIGIGYRNKSYDNFRMVEASDFGVELTEKFDFEMSRFNGFISLDDISIDKLNHHERQVALLDDNIICLNNTSYCRLSETKKDYTKGSVCIITDDTKIDVINKITSVFTDGANRKCKFAFFIRV